MRLLGIDPGNSVTGLSAFQDGVLEDSAWFDPWYMGLPGLAYSPTDRIYVEVPQNGTHASRGGVHFAAGMVVGRLCVRRRNVIRVTPSEWRKCLGLATRGKDKDYYVAACHDLVPGTDAVTDHNEAEAILIGLYGCKMEGLV